MLAKPLGGVNGKCVLVASLVCIKLELYWSIFAQLTSSHVLEKFMYL
jgi:hypothetical protein